MTGHHVSRDGTPVRANCSFRSIEPVVVAGTRKQYRERVAKENPVPNDAEPAEAPADRTPPPVETPPAAGRPEPEAGLAMLARLRRRHGLTP